MDATTKAVTKFVAQSGMIRLRPGQRYTCAKAKRDGACTLKPAQKLCPQTCGLCRAPAGWTWLRSSENFCLSTQQRCDPSTRCGDPLESVKGCQAAAADLGLATDVTMFKNRVAPQGCFVDLNNLTYFNQAGSGTSKYNFLKSLCKLKDVSSGASTFLMFDVATYDDRRIHVSCCVQDSCCLRQ